MLMKIHSYCAINGNFSTLDIKHKQTLSKLEKLCERPDIGGWEEAIVTAKTHREEVELAERAQFDFSSFGSTNESTPAHTPGLEFPSPRPGVDAPGGPAAPGLRQRLLAVRTDVPRLSDPEHPPPSPSRLAAADIDLPPVDTAARPSLPSPPPEHPLCYHPVAEVAELANTLSELDTELTSPGGVGNLETVRWPQNVTLWNFMDYQLIPTLVYELQYPRTERFVLGS